MQKVNFLILTLFPLLLWGCSTTHDFRFPFSYRIDIQQGNVVEPEAVAALKNGMTSQQVRYLLGAPLLIDPFHPDRWDYWYDLKVANGKSERQHVMLYFANARLVRVEKGNAAAPQPAKSD